jgi:phenylacetate-CoA ligase
MGYNPGDVIVAFDGSSVPEELRRNHVYWVKTGPGDIPYGRLSYSSLYMTRETMPYYVQHVLHCRPSILRGYPSFIADIADYILKNNISIPFSIKGVELTAENAYDWQVEKIKKAFRARVFFQYGHSEVSVFGYTFDDTYEYHCSPFYGYTEVLDSDRIHVKKGEIGEIVVTGFYNRAFPFVRYRTGDLAVFGGDEEGVVRLKKIIGRTQDYIYRRDGQRVALTALVFGQHYHAFRNMLKWQIVQGIPGRVEIRIVRGEGFSSDDEKEIRRRFKDICDVDVDFEFVDSIALTSRGKFKFLVQNIEP